MAGLGDLLRRMSHYTLANLANMAAGFVSFPILTRVLSVAEYGIMGLIVMLLNFVNSVAKLGLQHSSVRLFPEWENREGGREQFVFTIFIAALLVCVPVTALYDGAVLALRPWLSGRLFYFMLLSSPMILLNAMNSFGQNLLRARQWSGPRAIFEVTTTYAAMILAVLGAARVIGGLRGYYLGLMLGQALVAGVLVVYVLRWTRFRRGNWSSPALREALVFGLPMALFELCGVLVYLGDRTIIQWLLDEEAVGYYTVAFNLANYVNLLFSIPLDMAAVPMYTHIYEKEGAAATSDFLRKTARFVFLFALPVLAGMVVIREDIVALLASKRFLPGADLLHILLAAFLITGLRSLFAAGMFLRRRPWQMAGLEVGCAVLNSILCLVLIPRFGILGAAYATLVSQTLTTITCWALGSRLVRARVDLLPLFLHAACAAAMGIAIHYIDPGPGVVRLLLRLGAGVAIYGVLVLVVDGEARALVAKIARRTKGAE
jgi:O-antigen/teichoic acid export membrane protein